MIRVAPGRGLSVLTKKTQPFDLKLAHCPKQQTVELCQLLVYCAQSESDSALEVPR